MTNEIVYVDNNATTCVAPEVFAAMQPFLTEYYGNPSSVYPFSGPAAKAIEQARVSLAALVGATTEEIIFTSCGSESDSTAIMSALATQAGRRKILTTMVEHPAVLNVCRNLQKQGIHVDYLRVDSQGRIDLDEARALISSDTALVTVMFANNEIGNLYPVWELAEMAHAKGALFHTDAVQAVGKIPINLSGSAIDFLSLSGHKLHAPKGIGALYRRRFVPFAPFLAGGHQEHGQRAGTENVAGIAALGKAAELAQQHLAAEAVQLAALRDRLQAGLLASCPDAMVNGDLQHRLPNTLNICFKYIEGEAILLRLYQAGKICASSGSACTTGSLEPSHVLRAMGLDYQALHGSIRFSFSRYNTDQDVELILAVMPGIVKALRELSPFGRN
ncbi:MAG: cysteine desulfurase NifS [Oligosphaeraceae bacterium]|nr:cysteine desulfurase NifS [Oligosphaeraceae bacterium]